MLLARSLALAIDATGWAVGAGLKVNLPMLGAGDYVIAQAAYSEGAMNYIFGGNTGIGGFGYYQIGNATSTGWATCSTR